MIFNYCILTYEVGIGQTVRSEFYFLALFIPLLEHTCKQVSRGVKSNKQESLFIKNFIELACSVRVGKMLVLSFSSSFFKKRKLKKLNH